jgi:hypothetical protein
VRSILTMDSLEYVYTDQLYFLIDLTHSQCLPVGSIFLAFLPLLLLSYYLDIASVGTALYIHTLQLICEKDCFVLGLERYTC